MRNKQLFSRLFASLTFLAALAIAVFVYAFLYSKELKEEQVIYCGGITFPDDGINHKKAKAAGIHFNETGASLFKENCIMCHSFDRSMVGPNLKGVENRHSEEGLKNFIKDPGEVIKSGDPYAKELYELYQMLMPSFKHMSEAELDSIVEYIKYESIIR
ncbi:cytochrome c [Cytophagaceae bacterium ABcell3]|nr:cytochrome c [Cytophagaceae bacterium ABcell3]